MFNRSLSTVIESKIGKGKAIMVIGPRQVGKTTLIQQFLKRQDHLYFNGDDPTVRTIFKEPNTEKLRQIIGDKKIVYVDEAQRIEGIGLTLKIITDHFTDVQLWISGSSSFTLSHTLNEPLTGRKWQYELLPISWQEYEDKVGYLKAEQELGLRLRYGFYPDVLNNQGDEVEILNNLVSNYLYKDILSYAEIRKPKVLESLVQALAYQVGSEVNLTELSQIVGVDKNTVKRYIDILEKGYVIYQLNAYSRNLRNEIKKSKKIYFYDNGLRNMIIGNFNDLNLRNDIGALWENFLISERLKRNNYSRSLSRPYFWRSTQQQEIDYVEDNVGTLNAYEFKWSPSRKARLPKTFMDAYGAMGHIITRDNFRGFVRMDYDT